MDFILNLTVPALTFKRYMRSILCVDLMIMSPSMFDGIGRFFKKLFLWKIWFYHYC